MWLALDAHDAPREGIITSPRHGELRFCPEGSLRGERGTNWSVEGALAAIDADIRDGRIRTPANPDALARAWAALTCPTSGEVLLSAAPGYELTDWGKQALAGAPGESTPGLLGSSPPGPALSAASPPTGSGTRARAPASSGQSTSAGAPIPVAASDTPPAGRRLSSNQVLAIAQALPKMKALRREHAGSFADAYLKLPFRWQVSFFSRGGKKEIGQVIIDDTSGRVLEQWTGFQVAWTIARGYPGAFGRHVNALYVWLPLCALFLLPFINPRRPFSLLHLDLLVLLSLSVSLAFFNHGRIYASTPLVYPPLLYLLGRMLWLSRPGRAHTDRPRGSSGTGPRLLIPAPWLALGVVFLLGFRSALSVTDSNVIDGGYAGMVGAPRIVDG